MKLSKEEKETIINFSENDDTANVYSCSKKIWNKCEKNGYDLIDTNLDSNGNIISKTYEIEKRLVSFRKPRVLSDEHKEKLRKRAKVMRTGSEDLENFPKDNIVEDLKKEVSIIF
jgi:hypothetical protein